MGSAASLVQFVRRLRRNAFDFATDVPVRAKHHARGGGLHMADAASVPCEITDKKPHSWYKLD
eukprot:1256314-Rhodomonas_salina.1